MLLCLVCFLLIIILVKVIRFSFGALKIVAGLFLVSLLLILMCSVASAKEYSPEDVIIIGKVTQHEAGNQSELGKRLVIDTILNRVESPEFPNTVIDVVNQPGQYCSPSKYPPDGIYQLVAEEMINRTDDRVLWYRTKRYHSYGDPIIQEGAHYFSGR